MNEEKITIWEERIHACQNSDLTVAAWCREHQISVATYYYWRKRVSANDEMLSVKEPVFAELTNIRKAALSEEKEPLLISFNQLQLAVSTPAQAELAAVLISRMQSLCWAGLLPVRITSSLPVELLISGNRLRGYPLSFQWNTNWIHLPVAMFLSFAIGDAIPSRCSATMPTDLYWQPRNFWMAWNFNGQRMRRKWMRSQKSNWNGCWKGWKSSRKKHIIR